MICGRKPQRCLKPSNINGLHGFQNRDNLSGVCIAESIVVRLKVVMGVLLGKSAAILNSLGYLFHDLSTRLFVCYSVEMSDNSRSRRSMSRSNCLSSCF